MRRCERHPEQPAGGFCEKYRVWMCAECLRCQASQLYHQHRTAGLVFAAEEEAEPVPEERTETSWMKV